MDEEALYKAHLDLDALGHELFDALLNFSSMEPCAQHYDTLKMLSERLRTFVAHYGTLIAPEGDYYKCPKRRTVDAKEWAHDFYGYFGLEDTPRIDEVEVEAWFANAIMVGYDMGAEGKLLCKTGE